MTSRVLLAAAGYALAVGLLTSGGWPPYAVGMVCAVVLAGVMAAGSAALGGRPEVGATAYALTCVGAVLIGYFLVAAVGGGNPVWWPVGAFLAGAVAPWSGAVVPRPEEDDRA